MGMDFELTVLPEEILDFLPWISLVKADDKGSPSLVQSPPHPFEFITGGRVMQ